MCTIHSWARKSVQTIDTFLAFLSSHIKRIMVEALITTAIAAGRVPTDIAVDYLEQNRNAPAIGALIFLAIITSIFVAARLFSRAFIVKKFGLDDYLALLCLVSF